MSRIVDAMVSKAVALRMTRVQLVPIEFSRKRCQVQGTRRRGEAGRGGWSRRLFGDRRAAYRRRVLRVSQVIREDSSHGENVGRSSRERCREAVYLGKWVCRCYGVTG